MHFHISVIMIIIIADVNRVVTLPGILEFDNLGKRNLKKPGTLTIFTCSVVKFRFD